MTTICIQIAPNEEGCLLVRWPGQAPLSVTQERMDGLEEHLKAVVDAESDAYSRATGPAREAYGQALFELLDGPERFLELALQKQGAGAETLHLAVHLTGQPIGHGAAHWRWELMADRHGPIGCRQGVTLAVQIGEAQISEPVVLATGALRILFMAFSPQDVEPVLDYEGEEEAFLTALAPYIERGQARLEAVEDGTLAELERRLKVGEYDVVHLSGHGGMLDGRPHLMMEDEFGIKDSVGTDGLWKALKRARKLPSLLVLATCHSAESRPGLSSMAAGLVELGMPSVAGWVRPVRDDVATNCSRDLYDRLCTGAPLPVAIGFARGELLEWDRTQAMRTHAWGTFHCVGRSSAGFRLDTDLPVPSVQAVQPSETYAFLGDSQMRVLEQGFVGRRRELQRLVRILRYGKEGKQGRAGAVIWGMKGTGKSCLTGRGLDRHTQEMGSVGLVVLHGKLEEYQLLESFRQQALRWQDNEAEAVLCDTNLSFEKRLEKLLVGSWNRRELVIVLDDFEQNLETRAEGPARLSPSTAALLNALLPACKTGRPKLLVTSTALFELPKRFESHLAEVELGPMQPAVVNKLWSRSSESTGMPKGEWVNFAERLGRNARVLDWGRTLLEGRPHQEVQELVAKAKSKLPIFRDGVANEDEQNKLAALFLEHIAFKEADAKISSDAREFLTRARVYTEPAGANGFEGLTEGLEIDLDQALTALANLGLLEVARVGQERAFRVSPLIQPEFVALEPDRWEEAAARYWWKASETKLGHDAGQVFLAWQHAIRGRCLDVANLAGSLLRWHYHGQGLYGEKKRLAEQQLRTFPDDFNSLYLAGDAAQYTGDLAQSLRWLRQGEEMLGGGKVSENQSASLLHALAQVLQAQGDLAGARERLERSLEIDAKVYGTEEHPEVAASLHTLAQVLQAQGDLAGARERLERSLEIDAKVHGTEEHPEVAASLHALAGVLQAQGDLAGARERLERSLEIQAKVHGTEEHPEVAASLHALAGLAQAEENPEEAIRLLERVLQLESVIYGTRDHYSTAESEFVLGKLFMQADREEEGKELLIHAFQVLQAQVPNHPILKQLEPEKSGAEGLENVLVTLVKRCVQARQEGHPPEGALRKEVLEWGEGEPNTTIIAGYLFRLAEGRGLDRIVVGSEEVSFEVGLEALTREDVRQALKSIREVAEGVDAKQSV